MRRRTTQYKPITILINAVASALIAFGTMYPVTNNLGVSLAAAAVAAGTNMLGLAQDKPVRGRR